MMDALPYLQLGLLPLFGVVFPLLTLYIAWRAVMAVERLAQAVEKIERNTRSRSP